MKKFIFWIVLWNIGAGALFFCGLISATNMRDAAGTVPPHLFWWLGGISLIGMLGMYLHLDLAEQISWTHAEFHTLERYDEMWNFMGFIAFVTAGISCIIRFIDASPAPFFYTLWEGCASALFLMPSHILEVWRIENLEEYERETPLTRARYKQ